MRVGVGLPQSAGATTTSHWSSSTNCQHSKHREGAREGSARGESVRRVESAGQRQARASAGQRPARCAVCGCREHGKDSKSAANNQRQTSVLLCGVRCAVECRHAVECRYTLCRRYSNYWLAREQ